MFFYFFIFSKNFYEKFYSQRLLEIRMQESHIESHRFLLLPKRPQHTIWRNEAYQPACIFNKTSIHFYLYWGFFFSNFLRLKPLQLTNFFWAQLLWKQWITLTFGATIGWHFINLKKLANTESFTKYWYGLYKPKKLRFLFSKPLSFYFFLIKLIYFKLPHNLITYFQKQLCFLHLKKHKQIFYFLKVFLDRVYFYLLPNKKLLGYSFFFKGKLGRKGSVKKSIFFVKRGQISFTNKQLRVNYKQFTVNTETGVIGGAIHLFF